MLFKQWPFGDFLQASKVLKAQRGFPLTKQLHRGRKGSIFSLLKTCSDHCWQARDTWRGLESSSRSVCISWLTEVKQFSTFLPDLGSSGNSLRSQTALTFLGRKTSNKPHKTKAIYSFISSVCPKIHELFLLGSLWITSPALVLKNLRQLWGGSKKKRFLFLPILLLPALLSAFCSAAFELWILCCLSCGYQGQPKGRRWVIAFKWLQTIIQIGPEHRSSFTAKGLCPSTGQCSALSEISPWNFSACRYRSRNCSWCCYVESSELIRVLEWAGKSREIS